MSRIYKITDRTNNKVYIGQTKRDIYKRFAEHIYRALNSHCPDKKIEELITHQKVLLYNMNRELKESL